MFTVNFTHYKSILLQVGEDQDQVPGRLSAGGAGAADGQAGRVQARPLRRRHVGRPHSQAHLQRTRPQRRQPDPRAGKNHCVAFA